MLHIIWSVVNFGLVDLKTGNEYVYRKFFKLREESTTRTGLLLLLFL